MLLLLKWLLRQVCAQSSLPSLTSTVLQDALGLTLACLTPGLLPVEQMHLGRSQGTQDGQVMVERSECGLLEKGMANHFSILASRTP